jgi:hypothetical protein
VFPVRYELNIQMSNGQMKLVVSRVARAQDEAVRSQNCSSLHVRATFRLLRSSAMGQSHSRIPLFPSVSLSGAANRLLRCLFSQKFAVAIYSVALFFFNNPIVFTICTCTFSK